MNKTDSIEAAISRVLLKKGFLQLRDTMAKEDFRKWCAFVSAFVINTRHRNLHRDINDIIDDLPCNELDHAVTLMNVKLKSEERLERLKELKKSEKRLKEKCR